MKWYTSAEEQCKVQSTYTWFINAKDVFGKAHELKEHVTLS